MILSFTASMFLIWDWIGLQFTNASDGRSVIIGAILFLIVLRVALAIWTVIFNEIKWIVKG